MHTPEELEVFLPIARPKSAPSKLWNRIKVRQPFEALQTCQAKMQTATDFTFFRHKTHAAIERLESNTFHLHSNQYRNHASESIEKMHSPKAAPARPFAPHPTRN
jgi:hypothetical protein